MWTNYFENYGYVALAFGERQILISLAGFVAVILIGFCARRASARSMLFAWFCFWIWMLPFALLEPALSINMHGLDAILRGVREWMQVWLPLKILSPCELPFSERLSAGLTVLPALSWHELVLTIWLVLAAAKARSALSHRFELMKVVRRAPRAHSPALVARLDIWRDRYRLRRPVTIRSSHECDQIFTIGIFKPIVFLPSHLLSKLDNDDLEVVLGHELAHVKRCDDFFICAQLVAKTLLFFNPFVWLSAQRITALRERCCDTLAIRGGNLTPRNYANSLLRVAEMQSRHVFKTEVAAELIASILVERVRYALAPAKQRSTCMPGVAVIAALMLISALFSPDFSHPHVIGGGAAQQLLHRLNAVHPLPRHAPFGDFAVPAVACIHAPARDYHPGVDFVPADNGDRAVRAIADGRVESITKTSTRADVILQMQHAEGVVSTYTHMGNIAVREGQYLRAGQPLGLLEGDHLHVELRKGAALIDPSSL